MADTHHIADLWSLPNGLSTRPASPDGRFVTGAPFVRRDVEKRLDLPGFDSKWPPDVFLVRLFA